MYKMTRTRTKAVGEGKEGEGSGIQRNGSTDSVSWGIEERFLDILKFIETELGVGKTITEARVESLKGKFTKWAIVQAEINGRIMQLETELQTQRNLANMAKEHSSASYAQVTAGAGGINIQEKKKMDGATILISPKTGEDIKTTEKIFRELVDPRGDKIQITTIRSTKKALIVKTKSEEDVNKIMNNERLNKELKIEQPKKKRPLMVLYDVPKEIQQHELGEVVYMQNEVLDIKEGTFMEGFKPKFKMGPRNKNTVHHVIEVSPQVREMMIRSGRVHIDFTSVKVKDYLNIPKCFKCQDLGHIGKFCRSAVAVCAHCGGEGHTKNECGKLNLEEVCVPCKKRDKRCTKKGKECGTYKMMEEREKNRTDYGY